nr:permease [uncultured Gemmiger sp.]
MFDVIHREFVYLWYYFSVQLEQIFGWWVLGMVLGSAVSVFGKGRIHAAVAAVFQRYVPAEGFAALFGENEGFGVLLAATIGVPLYACGGGTIPLLQAWLADGMSMGAASAFMITGPATKITNLGALKIVLGVKHFAVYLAFVMLFSLATGLAVNLV